ncbi:MAG TPA: hypothetical protein VLC51_10040 [Nitrospira sp.]|nr:hypothetical protein [Nitrospira sp.]
MKTIYWNLTIGYPTADRDGEFEVEDDTTDEEIEAMVREEANNFIEWSWSKADNDAEGEIVAVPSDHRGS